MTERDAGEPEGFEEFYRASYPRTVAALYALTGDMGEAQDCAQEAYARLWSRWKHIADYSDPAAWVRTVGSRIAVSRWRRARTAARSLLRHGPPPLAAVPNPDSVALVAALRQLPESQRRTLVLHYIGGLPIAEIAEREGVAEGTIKARLHRGRAALRPLLSDDPTTTAEGGWEVLHA